MRNSNLLLILTSIRTSTQVAWQTLCAVYAYDAGLALKATQHGMGAG